MLRRAIPRMPLRPMGPVTRPLGGLLIAPTAQIRWNSDGEDPISHARPSANDLYARLGLARDATEKEIKQNYRLLAKKYHPDMNQGDPKAAEAFKRIQEAHGVLSTSTKRAFYDRTGATSNDFSGGASVRWTTEFRGRRTQQDGRVIFHLPIIWLVIAFLSSAAITVFSIKAASGHGGGIGRFLRTFGMILFCVSVMPRLPAAVVLYYLYGGADAAGDPEWGKAASAVVTLAPPPPGFVGNFGGQARPPPPPTRVVGLVGINGQFLQANGYSVQCIVARGGDAQPGVVNARPGETSVVLPGEMLRGGPFTGKLRVVDKNGTELLSRVWNMPPPPVPMPTKA